MNAKQPSTGYVPVTIELPPDLAAQFHKTNYNWEAFIRLVTTENSPCEVFDKLLDLYFDYTLLLPRMPEEITPQSEKMLHNCKQVMRAIQQMDNGTNLNPDDHGAGAYRSE